jgi:putative FmdB family regulatory protein
MPIYEYQCGKCKHVLEALQKFAEEPLKFCPECGADALKRLLSAPRFRLKGSGWYETDFKKDTDKRRNLASDSPSTPAAGASSASPSASSASASPGGSSGSSSSDSGSKTSS